MYSAFIASGRKSSRFRRIIKFTDNNAEVVLVRDYKYRIGDRSIGLLNQREKALVHI